ncbi:MAG TPA: alpha-glucuronidase family glycosyl hydrolase [Bryobacteraceae bacterium]|nr:alpha-glucuronidase family glycosyl hydrolase [Bryobacteraceae bacterium]
MPALFAGAFILACASIHAETGIDAWLRYAPLDEPALTQYRSAVPASITAIGKSDLQQSARDEIIRGIHGMLGRTLRATASASAEPAIQIGTLSELKLQATLPADGYWLKASGKNLLVAGADDRGALYGAFALLRKIALGEPLANLDEKQAPHVAIRWTNEWNNLDGTIERGYGGRSIFWNAMQAREDLSRAAGYARLLASLGINGCSINNVNANPRALAPEFIPEIAKVADAMRPWGVRVAIAVDFGSPKSVGGLDTFDPLDPKVAAWWAAQMDEIYKAVPDFAGIVLKADSEGRVGPSTYNRSHADAANVVARALKPHGGLLFYRGFVYDHHMDWNNPKNDRGRAAWDNFHDLDGKFDDNAIVQVKNGPIDFQVREPASPLFGAIPKTSESIEVQITQEYMGQGKHTVFLVPMWKDVLDFDMRDSSEHPTPVKSLVKAIVGVSNVGLDETWYGNHLSQANLYGFGRLAWNADLSSKQIASEWTRLTFGLDQKVDETIDSILLSSWRTYENYTGPLGLQTLTDIVGNHFGVNVEASERNGWGQWHRADEKGVGMDRTVATGTGYIGQYSKLVAATFESLATCPDDLLLFLHHVPYAYKLHSGKTVIQSIYDSHYEGSAAVEDYVREWRTLRGRVDEARYNDVLAQLEYQAGQAEVWRDAVNTWFAKASGIADAKGRVGHYPGRYEAEAMKLEGYAPRDITPAEDASGGKGVACTAAPCKASFQFDGAAGWYTLHVEYFDTSDGAARYKLTINGQPIDQWTAALPDWTTSATPVRRRLDSTSSTRRLIEGVALRPGDIVRIEGTPDKTEQAALDYVEVVR